MFDINIHGGADFRLTFYMRDPEGNLIDLTGSVIQAQLKPFAESPDAIDFDVEQNGAGGRCQLSLPKSTTEQIDFDKGVYDVMITDTDGIRTKVLYGMAKIIPAVTRPVPILPIDMRLEIVPDAAALPQPGIMYRIWYCYDTGTFYIWNGEQYKELKADVDWDLIVNKPESYPPSAHTHDDRYYTEGEVDTLLGSKQDTLTFDADPTENSSNPVTSDGIYAALYFKADGNHVHGNITNGGAINSNVSIQNNDRLVITNANDSNKLVSTSIQFDASTTTKALTKAGTFESVSQPGHEHTMSEVTDLPTLGSMAAVNDAPSDGSEYVRKNGAWTVASGGGGSADWGDIGGDLDDQTDLKDALDAKLESVTPATDTIGSATAGTAISAHNISSWSAGTLGSASYDDDTETLVISFGSLPSLSYTEKTIPNISVTSKTVVTGITTA